MHYNDNSTMDIPLAHNYPYTDRVQFNVSIEDQQITFGIIESCFIRPSHKVPVRLI
jgi:hypothetical protein